MYTCLMPSSDTTFDLQGSGVTLFCSEEPCTRVWCPDQTADLIWQGSEVTLFCSGWCARFRLQILFAGQWSHSYLWGHVLTVQDIKMAPYVPFNNVGSDFCCLRGVFESLWWGIQWKASSPSLALNTVNQSSLFKILQDTRIAGMEERRERRCALFVWNTAGHTYCRNRREKGNTEDVLSLFKVLQDTRIAVIEERRETQKMCSLC